jgi:hypothetical protein
MIYELALTPGLFSENDNISSLFSLQNLLNTIVKDSHLIGVVRKKLWRPAVYDAIASLEHPFREKIGNLLNTLKDRGRFISRQYQTNPENPPETDPEWLNEFLLAHRENPFNAIVTLLTSRENCDGLKDCVHELESILDAPMLQNYERSKQVKREVSEFIKILKPLLLYSRSILLIDPHIDPTVQRYKRPITGIINEAFDRGRYPSPAFFEIHLKAKEDIPEQEKKIKEGFGPLMNPGTQARVVLWAEREIQETFHNRFILTDLCGIRVGQGLDEPKHGGPDHDDWDVMGETHRQEIWRQFQKGSTTFDQKHEFYLTPSL